MSHTPHPTLKDDAIVALLRAHPGVEAMLTVTDVRDQVKPQEPVTYSRKLLLRVHGVRTGKGLGGDYLAVTRKLPDDAGSDDVLSALIDLLQEWDATP